MSIPALAPTPVYPYLVPPLTDVTPFTYRDGTTYLEVLEQLTAYVQQTLTTGIDTSNSTMVTNVNTALAAFNTTIQAINNRVGPAPIVTATLTANYTVAIDPTWPTLQPVFFDLTQDGTGGRTVTLPAAVTGTVTVNSAAGARTQFWLIPHGDTPLTWHVYQTQAETGAAIAALNLASTYLTQANAAATYLTQSNASATYQTQAAAITAQNNATAATNALTTRLDDNGFLFGCFTSNAGSAGQWGAGGEALSLFYSPDGRSAFSGGVHYAYVPADGAGLRDPSMLYWNGKFYVAYTRNNGLDKNFAIAVSESGAPGSFTLLATVSESSIATMTRCWAPEWVVDPATNNVYIFFASVDASNHGSVYWIQALDSTLGNWSTPTHMSWSAGGEPVHYIDPCLVKHTDGNWYLFYSTGSDILRAKSTTGLTGTYTTDQGAANWTGWGSSIEAPEVVWDETANTYRAYFDQFSPETGYHWSESTDLTTWTAPQPVQVADGSLRSTEVLRHGSFMPLKSRRQANKAIAGQAMQGSLLHAEFTFSVTLANGGAGTTITSWAVDTNETLDANFVTVDANGHFTFNTMGLYAIDLDCGNTAGATVTRGFVSLYDQDGTTELVRASSGVENIQHLAIPNFLPRNAGRYVSFLAFLAWSSAQTNITVTGRARFTCLRKD